MNRVMPITPSRHLWENEHVRRMRNLQREFTDAGMEAVEAELEISILLDGDPLVGGYLMDAMHGDGHQRIPELLARRQHAHLRPNRSKRPLKADLDGNTYNANDALAYADRGLLDVAGDDVLPFCQLESAFDDLEDSEDD